MDIAMDIAAGRTLDNLVANLSVTRFPGEDDASLRFRAAVRMFTTPMARSGSTQRLIYLLLKLRAVGPHAKQFLPVGVAL